MSDEEVHGPLELPDGAVSDAELDRYSTLQHVRTKLAEMGVEEPMKPDHEVPEVPSDISAITDKEIADLYSRLLAWDSYFTLQAAWADAELKEAKNKLALITTKLVGSPRKKLGDYEMDSRVLQAKTEVQSIEQTAGILEATHKVLTSKLRVVSRVIEVRRQDWEKSQRDGNIRSPLAYPAHSRLGAKR